MDRKSLLLLAATCVVLILWYPLMNKLYPPKPLPPPATNLPASPGATERLAEVLGSTNPVEVITRTLAPGVADPGFRAPATNEQTLTLETDAARYVFTSHGGGLRHVELKGYPDTVACGRNRSAEPEPVRFNRLAPTPLFAVLGTEAGNGAQAYSLRQEGGKVIAERALPGGLFVVKEFRPESNYLVSATLRLENRAATNVMVPPHELVIGTAAPVHTNDSPLFLGLFAGRDGGHKRIDQAWFANRTLGCFPGTPRAEFISEWTNTAWAAVHNQFFAAIAIATNEPARAGSVRARQIDLAHPAGAPAAGPPLFGFQTAVAYPGLVIPPASALVRGYTYYVGPREYRLLSRLGGDQDVVMGFDNFFGGRFSGFFARGLLLAMNGLHGFGLSYGLAIIVITIIIKTLFFPLTQASTRSMKRMAALQPQMKALQDKYKDNPQKMNQKLMEFMREHRVNPAGGCIPILLQIPVFLGFYAMLQTAIELRGASFLWVCDLSASDTIFTIPGINFPVNPLPIVMAGTMLWQARLTPMAPNMDPMQQKIMKYMPLMFVVFLYSFSAGLTLYWTVQNLFSIAQMKLTRKLDDPAAEKAAAAPAKRAK
ncbi:MAG: YidC/Oxa1 family insertase periplasmic-domain containing protein [Limisphaerales bacterium]